MAKDMAAALAELQAVVADLQAKVTRLEDERDILETLHRYCHSFDYEQEREWADCFTEDALLETRDRDGVANPRLGRAAIADILTRAATKERPYQRHLMGMPLITIHGNNASALSYNILPAASAAGELYLQLFARYRDRLVKQEDGKWRFQERIVEQECRADK